MPDEREILLFLDLIDVFFFLFFFCRAGQLRTGDLNALAPDGHLARRIVVFFFNNGPEFRHGADLGPELPARNGCGLLPGSFTSSGRHAPDETRRQLHGMIRHKTRRSNNFPPFQLRLRKIRRVAAESKVSEKIFQPKGRRITHYPCLCVCMN